jgi:Fe2+ or Zn2+ uptake regulation protein
VGDPPDPEAYDKKIGASLMRYLVEHPQAMDTAEGIAEWWTRDGESRDVETVRRVLGHLINQGLVERIGSGKYAHYRLRKDMDPS